MPIKMSVDQFRAQIANLQTELGLLRQQMKVKQLETYDAPMPVNNAGGAPF
jgi:ribosomal protein L29